jgi:hypothetical protein
MSPGATSTKLKEETETRPPAVTQTSAASTSVAADEQRMPAEEEEDEEEEEEVVVVAAVESEGARWWRSATMPFLEALARFLTGLRYRCGSSHSGSTLRARHVQNRSTASLTPEIISLVCP